MVLPVNIIFKSDKENYDNNELWKVNKVLVNKL